MTKYFTWKRIRRLKVQISLCPFQRCQLNLQMQITGFCVPQKQVHCFKIPFILQINCTTGVNCNTTFIQITWWWYGAPCLIEKVFLSPDLISGGDSSKIRGPILFKIASKQLNQSEHFDLLTRQLLPRPFRLLSSK